MIVSQVNKEPIFIEADLEMAVYSKTSRDPYKKEDQANEKKDSRRLAVLTG